MSRRRLIDPANFCLVLAASIKVNVMPGVGIVDPQRREQDYLSVLEYYLSHHPKFKRYLLIENSGWPLDAFRAVAERVASQGVQIELMSLNENAFPAHLGKSYGEMLLLEKGLAQSTLALESKYLLKLTGRIRVLNLTQVVESFRRHFDFACDVQDHPFYEWLRIPSTGRKADTRLMLFRQRFFDKYLRGRLDELDERRGEFLEDFIYRITKQIGAGERIIDRLPCEANFAGIAGTGTKDYASFRERAKRGIRAACRRLLPWIKI